GRSSLEPSSRSSISQLGGKIEDTRTRLCWAIFASRSAISKLVSFSLWMPTPVVKKIFLGTSCSPWNTVITSSSLGDPRGKTPPPDGRRANCTKTCGGRNRRKRAVRCRAEAARARGGRRGEARSRSDRLDGAAEPGGRQLDARAPTRAAQTVDLEAVAGGR